MKRNILLLFTALLLSLQMPAMADPPALPVKIVSSDPLLRYVGRFDRKDPAGPWCAWSASSVILKVRARDVNVTLNEDGRNFWQVVIDEKASSVIEAQGGEHTYTVAAGLPAGEHTIRLVKRTEFAVGKTQILGFTLSEGGKLLPVPPASRRIEVIGDSISCGYGNEAPSQFEQFTPATENAWMTYGAIAARAVQADYICVAISGKKMWPDNTLPEFYDKILPGAGGGTWDFESWVPDVVLINLATNDFGRKNPEEAEWIEAYKMFVARVRGNYPGAHIYLALGTMMVDGSEARKPATTARGYLTRIVKDLNTAGDKKVHFIDFGTQSIELNGVGANYHPSAKTNGVMAEQWVVALRSDLGW